MRHNKKIRQWVTAAAACLVTAAVAVAIIVLARPPAPPNGSSNSLPAPSAAQAPSSAAPDSLPDSASEPVPTKTEGDLELPIEGATGFTLIDTGLRARPAEEAEAETQLPAGAGFAVLEEQGGWWRVAGDDFSGWLLSAKCMVNLPDVIPSIVYDNTNAYASAFLTCGQEIPEITGEALYEARFANPRLGREEYVMPVLYPMAKRICAAQRAALAEGNTLVIIEAFRPWQTQRAVVQAVTALAAVDEAVNEALNAAPWGMNWFIATGVSNHQQGYAVDLTLARVDASEEAFCGPYGYTRVTAHTVYEMQTPIHELSPASAALSVPLDPRSGEWAGLDPAPGMNALALTLQRYCTGAGMTPLASEWWHFNDYTALDPEITTQGTGNFTVDACRSFIPPAAQG